MRRYILRRLLVIPVVLLGIVTVAFAITHLVPSNPLASVLSERQLSNPEAVAAAEAKYGLDKSLPEQYVIYIKNLLTGDAGTSFVTKQPVSSDLARRLPATLELTLAAMSVAIVGGLAVGVFVSTRHNKLSDHLGRLFALVGSSVPVYWSGLVLLLIFSVKLGWLPGPGRLDSRSVAPPDVTGFYTIDSLLDGDVPKFVEAVKHLVLPAIVLGWGVMGTVSRIVRASMLDVLSQDYVRTARAKGARESTVVVRHALRNAMIPAMTIVGFSVAYLITNAVLVESIFSWPGIGSYAVNGAQTLDFPAIMGVCMLGGLAFLLANFVTDLGYALADPAHQVVVNVVDPTLTLSGRVERRSRRRSASWLRIPLLISIGVIVFWVIMALTITWWAPFDPLERVGAALEPPSGKHWLGTDGLGRDVFTRTLWGARTSMPLALAVIVFGAGLGCILGAIAGFVGGWVDSVIMRLADITLAFPAILLAMVVTAALGKGIVNIGVAMVVVWWPIYARLLRAQVLAVKEQEHVESARAAGAGKWRVLLIHVLPLSMTPVLVNATMDFGLVVLLSAGLSYVGLGAVPPNPEWGLAINEGTLHFHQWWVAGGPGIAILTIVLAFNFLGDGLRDYLDVRMR